MKLLAQHPLTVQCINQELKNNNKMAFIRYFLLTPYWHHTSNSKDKNKNVFSYAMFTHNILS